MNSIIDSFKKFILYLSLLSIAFSCACSTSREQIKKITQNQSHYHLQRLNGSQGIDSAVVVLEAYRMDDGVTKRFGYFSADVNGANMYEVKGDSIITLKLKPGAYYFSATSVGYDTVQTKKVNLSLNDSLLIDFHLDIEFQPIE